jgi:predicted lipoprotein
VLESRSLSESSVQSIFHITFTEGLLRAEIRNAVDSVNVQFDASTRTTRDQSRAMNETLLANTKEVQDLPASAQRDQSPVAELRAEHCKASESARSLYEAHHRPFSLSKHCEFELEN